MSTQSAWSSYRANANGGVGERDELIYAAHRQPAETWAFIRDRFAPETSDTVLGLLAMEIVDGLKTRSHGELWPAVLDDARSRPQLARVLAALQRYDAKSEWLKARLAGKSTPLPDFGNADLPLPNPHDECARHTHTTPEPLPRAVISKYLARDYSAWDEVHSVIGSAPDAALDLFLSLLPKAQDRNALAIDLLEPALAKHESAIADRVLAEVTANRRFREALRACNLDVSEPFLDRLIVAVQNAR